MFQTNVVKKINTRFIFNNIPPAENRSFMTLRKNMIEADRPQMAIWRMFIACWIPKATNIHSYYEIHAVLSFG